MHFSLATKHHWSDLLQQRDTLACTHQMGHFISEFIFHLVQNVYHMPDSPAAGHLVFVDSAHSISLPNPSVKSRETTQSKLSLLQKTVFLFFQKTKFGNTFKILYSLPWIQGPAPEDVKPPLPPKSFPTPTSAGGFTGPSVLIGIFQLLSHVWLFVIICTAAKQASLSFTILWSFLKLMSIESVMSSHHLILLTPLLLPTIFPASGSLPMSWLFTSDSLIVGVSSSASVLPLNIALPLPKQNSCFHSSNKIEH